MFTGRVVSLKRPKAAEGSQWLLRHIIGPILKELLRAYSKTTSAKSAGAEQFVRWLGFTAIPASD
jgi:hypothetical protein